MGSDQAKGRGKNGEYTANNQEGMWKINPQPKDHRYEINSHSAEFVLNKNGFLLLNCTSTHQ